jgi:homoserine O-acetyltransferase
MKGILRLNIIIMLIFLWSGPALGQGALRYADLGDYVLENGQIIRDCRIAYRTFGVLNSSNANVVLFPTWFAGTTQELVDLGFIGPGKLADSSKHFIVAVDAIGNGVSSSPSNSKLQPEKSFPRFSIRDMVKMQHLLLTRYLDIHRLHGVIGISMGGMMTYQWMVSYPEFLHKAVAVAGSPRLTAYDLLLWQAELGAIELAQNDPDGKAMKTLAAIHHLHLQTPRHISKNVAPEAVSQFLSKLGKDIKKYNPFDWAWQLNAITDHDIYRSFGNSAQKSAEAVRAKTLIIWALQDLMVNPEPAQTYAKLLRAETFVLTGECGHLSFLCEADALRETVRRFLD